MFAGFGSTWEDNFYMGTQNGSKTMFDLRLTPFRISYGPLKFWKITISQTAPPAPGSPARSAERSGFETRSPCRNLQCFR